MEAEPKIPHGYTQVTGQLQKGDGLWDGTRFRKVRREYPFIGERVGVAVRKCEVVQTEISMADVNELAKLTTPLCVKIMDEYDAAKEKFIQQLTGLDGECLDE